MWFLHKKKENQNKLRNKNSNTLLFCLLRRTPEIRFPPSPFGYRLCYEKRYVWARVRYKRRITWPSYAFRSLPNPLLLQKRTGEKKTKPNQTKKNPKH